MTKSQLSDEIYRAMFENAGVGITRVDLNGSLVDVNQTFCDMVGYAREALLNRPLSELTHSDDYGIGAGFREQISRGSIKSATGEKRFVHKDGSIIWVQRTMSTVNDDAGQPQYVISVVENITKRKEVERRQTIEHAVTLSLADASSIAEAIPRVIQIMCEGLGYAYGARWVLDSVDGVLRATESWCLADAGIEQFRGISTSRVEMPAQGGGGLNRAVWATGVPVWIADVEAETNLKRRVPALEVGLRSAFAFPILVGGEFYGVTEFFGREVRQRDEKILEIVRTVSHQIGQFIGRKQAEAALHAANEELTSKAQQLSRSNAELEQFAYVASHDLQEPLRMIASYTQLLLRRYGDRFDGDAKEFMDFIVDGAGRMKQLIQDLLAYSRVGTHGKAFRPTDSGVAVQKALANLRAAIESSAGVVQYDSLPTINADEFQLVQLFQNLIGNALKFKGEAAPCIQIKAEERDDVWAFAVKDNGIGINGEYFERIFMVFQRLHARTEYPGTGIGLAICKKVVDRHGGRIWIESEAGQGSTFWFTLSKTVEGVHE